LVAAGTPCTTNILDLFGPGLGNRVRNPGLNFAPQFGFAWDPKKDAKTVVRGGIGLYYENSIFNNNLFNRPGRLAQGLFLSEAFPCVGGQANTPFVLPNGVQVPDATLNAICGQPMGSVATQLAALQQQFQAATLQAGPAVNTAFIGNTLAAGSGVNGINMFAPNYQTPRSVQINIGFERQLGKGVVWTADYVRNVATHTLLAVDVNHVGDVRFFSKANAQAAITQTLANCGVASINLAIVNCPTNPDTSQPDPTYVPRPATIQDFAINGLDSGTNFAGGLPAPSAAFPGQNPNLGVNQMLFPAGRSVYNAFETSLRANVARPFTGVKALSWQFSYALSRYVGSALDSDFINTAIDNNHPTSSLGPNGLDRTHQFSWGGTFDLPGGLRFSSVGHLYSPLPLSLTLPGAGLGGIFQSDFTGDGSGDGSGVYPVGDLLPGTKIGAFGRGIKTGDLAAFITSYNNTFAGHATPAGQALINSGVMTLAQLQALGGVMPQLALPPAGQVGLGWLKTFDFKLAYPRRIGETFSIEPSVSIFNAFNNANFDAPGNTMSGVLALQGDTTTTGTANTTTAANRTTRVIPGSGVFDLGAPRVFEFGLKFQF
jgi:hypothetical protein